MDDETAVDIANDVNELQGSIDWLMNRIPNEWGIVRQQMMNAINLLQDAERRLRNGDDLRG